MKKLAILLTLIIVVLCSTTAVYAAPPSGGPPGLERAIAVQEAHSPRLLRTPGVVGTAVGLNSDGKHVVKVFTERAGVSGLPDSLDGVPVSVKVIGKITALARPAPSASFDFSVTGYTVYFDASASSGTRISYAWDFGDDSDGSGVTVSHTYADNAELRSYTVRLTVTDKFGEYSSMSKEVAVPLSSGNIPPVASFTYNVNNLTGDFDASSSFDTDGWISSYEWDFGDGSTGSGVTSSHTYASDNVYTVTLTVTDNDGDTGSVSQDIVVGEVSYPPMYYNRPVPIGVSTGNSNSVSAGTIACRVRDSQGNLYALSNTHVYAPDNLDNLGAIGNIVSQPGLYDIPPDYEYTPAYYLGQLTEYVPIDGSILAIFFDLNFVDAAIARTDAAHLGQATPTWGYGTPKSAVETPVLGMQVQKAGRTTGLTHGVITGINAKIIVGYGPDWYAAFSKQIVIESNDQFIGAGDSGSLLVTEDNDPVGLLFAGDDPGQTAFANEMGRVLRTLKINIDGE